MCVISLCARGALASAARRRSTAALCGSIAVVGSRAWRHDRGLVLRFVMASICYASGDEVRIGDIADVGGGHGPRMRVVVIIPSGEAAPGFNASEWAYLKQGVVLQDVKVFGLLYLEEFDEEQVLVQRQ